MAGVLGFIMVTGVGADGNTAEIKATGVTVKIGNTAEIKATGVTKNDNTAKMEIKNTVVDSGRRSSGIVTSGPFPEVPGICC